MNEKLADLPGQIALALFRDQPVPDGLYEHECDAIADVVLSLPALQRLVEQAAEAARLRAAVETVATTCRTMGLTLHSVPHAETYAEIAIDLQRALDGTDG